MKILTITSLLLLLLSNCRQEYDMIPNSPVSKSDSINQYDPHEILNGLMDQSSAVAAGPALQTYTLNNVSTWGRPNYFNPGEVIISLDTMNKKIFIYGNKDSIFHHHGVFDYEMLDTLWPQYDPRSRITRYNKETWFCVPAHVRVRRLVQAYSNSQLRFMNDYDPRIADEEDYFTFVKF